MKQVCRGVIAAQVGAAVVGDLSLDGLTNGNKALHDLAAVDNQVGDRALGVVYPEDPGIGDEGTGVTDLAT